METGRKILNLRKDRGYAQKTLADLTAVTPSALSRIESGRHQPRGMVALRLARHLGVTVEYLLDEDAPYPPPARQLLADIQSADIPSPEGSKTVSRDVTEREARLLERLRELDPERRLLLEATLDASRDTVRAAAYFLGCADELPGFTSDEEASIRRRFQ